MLSLNIPLNQLPKIRPAYLKRLYKLKINTIADLFFHFPHRYDDFSKILAISELKEGQKATIRANIIQIKNRRIFPRRMTLTEAWLKDNSGTIKAIWFNQPYLTDSLKEGQIVNLSGKLAFNKNTLCFSNPVYELAKEDTTHTGRLVPIYPETEGLTSRYLRFLIKPLLPLTKQFNDWLPFAIRKKFQLMDLNQAIKQAHFPDNLLSARKARDRLAFDELFLVQLILQNQKQKMARENAIAIPFNEKLIKSFVKNLPFKLTDDQRISAWQIFQDLTKPKPMNRLLNGDVGSGKTIVAMMAALETAKTGYQVALMAPTEVLARQHFEAFNQFLKGAKLNIGLLTSADVKISKSHSDKKIAKTKIKKQIAVGKINIILGTHALIQKDLVFKKLALAIIDEQHRFGVGQRAALQNNIFHLRDGLKTLPHLLSMTATPIPRTLALSLYADLDISFLKQMPRDRQKIITRLAAPADYQKTYDFIREQIKQKRQVFVICPLIEESEKLEVKSVNEEYKKLSEKIFPEFKIAMLHGRMKSKEKEAIMKDFKNRQFDILISTSVVEVGVDVPNAAVIMIEGAERFGLAQLHQFRGRIGRGIHQSYCFLFSDSPAIKSNQRLKAIISHDSGFELAEMDLKLRGAGDFIGSRQWGLPDLTMASLNDLALVQQARLAARMVAEKNLLFPALSEKLKKFEKNIHFE